MVCLQKHIRFCINEQCSVVLAISKSSTSPYLWHIKRDQSVILGATARSNQQGGRVSLQCTLGSTQWNRVLQCTLGSSVTATAHSGEKLNTVLQCTVGSPVAEPAYLPAGPLTQPLSLATVHISTSLICSQWHILFMNTRLSLRQISSKNIKDIKKNF